MQGQIRIKDRVVPYKLFKRDVKYGRLEFKTISLEVVLPRRQRDEKKLINKHREWIYKKYCRIENALNESPPKDINYKRSRESLKIEARKKADEFSLLFGGRINKIFVRKMSTKWASLSSRSNITLNSIVKFLPEELIEYIIYHEAAHLKERKHGKSFKALMKKKYSNWRDLEAELFKYWFILQKEN
ncbi:MAG: M48 family metallopeptidase [Elusimicrobiota bacterium]|nr:M48 family metallopeptidase [Elusimicrobiota bacterium]